MFTLPKSLAQFLLALLTVVLAADPWDDETDHCIGLVWSEGGSISLHDYLADCCKPFADKFKYAVNGEPCGGALAFGKEPKEFHPRAFHVELRRKSDGVTLDRMWVVVSVRKARENFDKWCRKYSDVTWVSTLPRPYARLAISTNFIGRISAAPLYPAHPDPWNSPSKVSDYLHHDSKWEMRSKKVGDHGNQACYDGGGCIVVSGIAGGTADYYYAGGLSVPDHVSEDVNPFLNALHLDGNPGDTGWLNGISRPCLYQGDNLDQYIERRPIVQP